MKQLPNLTPNQLKVYETISRNRMAWAALWCVLPVLLLGFAGGIACALLALAGVAAAWIGLLRFFRHRPGGFDEARAAALQQACEAAFYLGASLGA